MSKRLPELNTIEQVVEHLAQTMQKLNELTHANRDELFEDPEYAGHNPLALKVVELTSPALKLAAEALVKMLPPDPENSPAQPLDNFLASHLKFWRQEAESGPANEINSIQGWLMYLGSNGAEMTKRTMRNRLLLLQRQAVAVYNAGPEGEDRVGIYENRPDLIPTPRREPDAQPAVIDEDEEEDLYGPDPEED